MMPSDPSVRYLEQAGIRYKPAESPDLWAHLESHFYGPRPIGPKFSSLPAAQIDEMIAKGEAALLEAMVAQHRRTGRVDRIACLIDLPYVVGAEASLVPGMSDSARLLRLIEQPGTPGERLIAVLPAEADAIPSTHQATVTGGPYPDGHTAGYYDLVPGRGPAQGAAGTPAYLATAAEIESLAREMETKMDDIAVVTRAECAAMIGKARNLL